MRGGIIGAATGVIGMLVAAGPALAQANGTQPAGGAALGEAIGATAGALVATALVVLADLAPPRGPHGHPRTASARWAERQTGLPAWASVPSMLLGVSLLVAVLGMYWDISLHIDNGRDPGPLANPAHYLILVGLYGVLVAGVMSIVHVRDRAPRQDRRPPRRRLVGARRRPDDGRLRRLRAARLPARRHLAPAVRPGRHALGPDPPDADRRRVARDARRHGADGRGHHGDSGATPSARPRRWLYQVRRALLVGSFLVALSTFQAEFDFGVPQFREVYQPILIMLAAGIGLVTCRLFVGRGGALLAVGGYLVIRGFLTLMVGVVWGEVTPHFPLYIVEALLVEAVFASRGAAAARW